jgi:NAD(P)-dependent dehydrogenase (short-subunit alcohol dehydrogenase family)
MELTAKTVIVTGGGAGIGREVAAQLIARGAVVHVLDLKVGSVAASPSLIPHQIDITDRSAVDRLAAEIGAVDAVVNVAGIVQDFVDISKMEQATIDHVMAVNFGGTVNVTRAFLPALLGRGEGAVVNVSSMGALAPVPGQSAYGASKAAVALFTQGLRVELRKTGVTVSVVYPGGVNTEITKNSGVESTAEAEADPATEARMRKMLTQPAAAAAKIVRAVEKGTPRVIIGKDARVVDLLSRLMPVRTASLLAGLMGKLM